MKSLTLALALPTLVLASGTGGKILICSLQPVRRVKRRPKTIKMARHRPTKANWLKLLLHYWCRKKGFAPESETLTKLSLVIRTKSRSECKEICVMVQNCDTFTWSSTSFKCELKKHINNDYGIDLGINALSIMSSTLVCYVSPKKILFVFTAFYT